MLKNIRIRWDPVEDRLIVRLTSQTEGGDIDHWMQVTRRSAIAWRKDLDSLVSRSAAVPERFDSHVKATLTAAHHQAVADKAAMRIEPAETTVAAVPAELVLRVRCGQRREANEWVHVFELRNGHKVTLNMTETTMHGLVKALDNQLAASQWGILPERTEPEPTTPEIRNALH